MNTKAIREAAEAVARGNSYMAAQTNLTQPEMLCLDPATVLALCDAADGNKWRPIESAPMTGEPIILAKIAATEASPSLNICARPPHVWWAIKGRWSHRWAKWWDGIEPSGLAGPTHWMPLPNTPEADDE